MSYSRFLKDINALGIIGHTEERYELLKTFVLDIVARQYHSEVKLFFIGSKNYAELFRVFRYLPHVNGMNY